jgi:tRNA wybutosine-synthesizing protein 3
MPAVAAADVSVHVSDTPHLDFVRKNFTFTNVPFGDLLGALAAEGENGGSGGGGWVGQKGSGDCEKENTAEKVTKKKWYYLRSIGRNPRKEPAHALEQFPDLARELKLPSDVLWGGTVGPSASTSASASVSSTLTPATPSLASTPPANDRYFSTVLRCSSGGLRLWTHYDAMDNALVQLHGEKRVLLFPPRAGAGLYLDGSSCPVVGGQGFRV